jgi:hypothetical protein
VAQSARPLGKGLFHRPRARRSRTRRRSPGLGDRRKLPHAAGAGFLRGSVCASCGPRLGPLADRRPRERNCPPGLALSLRDLARFGQWLIDARNNSRGSRIPILVHRNADRLGRAANSEEFRTCGPAEGQRTALRFCPPWRSPEPGRHHRSLRQQPVRRFRSSTGDRRLCRLSEGSHCRDAGDARAGLGCPGFGSAADGQTLSFLLRSHRGVPGGPWDSRGAAACESAIDHQLRLLQLLDCQQASWSAQRESIIEAVRPVMASNRRQNST